MNKILRATFPIGLAWCCASAGEIAVPSATDIRAQNQAIGQALAAAAPIKAGVERFRLRTKAFPASNADAGMNPPAAYGNYDVKRIAIGGDGTIEITLNATSGIDGGVIRLMPKAAANTDQDMIEWSCSSPSYSAIADATGGVCEYSNQP